MATFDELVKRYQQNRPQQGAAYKPTEGLDFSGIGGKSAEEQKPQSPLNWLLDMVSRPLYGVTELGESIIDAATPGGDLQGQAPKDFLSTVGDIATALPRGLTSTDSDDKKSFGQLLEYGTDRAGTAYDPGYVDTENNVDPVAKGVLGFVGDVVLDPTMYIPATWLAKGAGMLGRGAKALTGADRTKAALLDAMRKTETTEKVDLNALAPATDDIPRATDAADEVAALAPGRDVVLDDTVGILEDAPTPRPAPPEDIYTTGSVLEAIAPRARFTAGADGVAERTAGATDNVVDAPAAPKPVEEPPTPSAAPVLTPEEQTAAFFAGLRSTIDDSTNAETLRKAFDQAEASVGVPRTAPKMDPKKRALITVDTLAEVAPNDVLTFSARQLEQVARAIQADPRQLSALTDGGVVSMRQLADITRSSMPGNAVIGQRLVNFLRDPKMLPFLQAAEARGDLSEAAIKAFADAPSQVAANTQEAFRARLVETKVGEVLGDELTDWLLKMSPDAFEGVRVQLRNLLEPDVDIKNWLESNPDLMSRVPQFLRSLNINVPRSALEGSVQKVKAAQLGMMVGDLNIAGDAVGRAWGRDFTKADEVYTVPVNKRTSREGVDPTKDDARRMRESNAFTNANVYKALQDDVFGKTPDPRAQAEFLEIANSLRTSKDVRVDRNGKRLRGAFEETREVFGSLRARAFAEYQLRQLAHVDSIYDAVGIQAFISQKVSYRKLFGLTGQPIPLSMADVYGIPFRAAEQAGKEGVLLRTLFGPNYIPPTHYQGVIARVVEGGDADEIAQLLRRNDSVNRSRTTLPHPLAGPQTKRLDPTWAGGKPTFKTDSSEAVAREMAELLTSPEIVAALRTRAAENKAAYLARIGKETQILSQKQLRLVDEFVQDGSSRAATLKAISDTPKNIAKDATENGMLRPSQDLAVDLTKGSIGDVKAGISEEAVRAEGRVSRAPSVTSTALVKYVAPVQDRAATAVADHAIADATATGGWEDELFDFFDSLASGRNPFADDAADLIGKGGGKKPPKPPKKGRKRENWVEIAVVSMGSARNIQETMRTTLTGFGRLQSAFSQSLGMERLNALRLSAETSAGLFSSHLARQLDNLARTHTKADGASSAWTSAFDAIRRGTPEGLSDDVLPLYQGMKQIADELLPTGPNDGMLSSILFHNADIGMLNRIFEDMQLDRYAKAPGGGPLFDLDLAADAVKAGDFTDVGTALAQQWRNWEITDPKGFLASMAYATASAAERRAFVSSFDDMASRLGMVWDPAKQPKGARPPAGYGRVQVEGTSFYGAFVDPHKLYDTSILHELAVADSFARQPKRAMNDFVQKYLIPTTNFWKFGITQLRPGHHIRNHIGDESITWVARGNRNYVSSSKKALEILAYHREYLDVDSAAVLRGLEVSETRGSKVFVSGKYGDLTGDEIYQEALSRGLFPSVYVGEDLLVGETGEMLNGYAKLMDKLSLRNTTAGRFAGDVSEYRDHYSRLHHFMQVLEQESKSGKFADKEDLLAAAVAEVRKYHPDASMLTRFESKYMRLALPFYSWFRGILPAIIDSTLRHPHRVTVFPKASFNLALASGVNPESLSNPYPDDQLFPSFITGQVLGPNFQLPSGEYMAINPGFAHVDVFNELGVDPVRSILGMTNPIFRVPAELASGGMWSTGGRIKDTSDYLDSSLPFLNYIGNVSGYSPTSVLLDGGLQKQAGQESGSKGPLDQGLSVLNWLTGAGVSNLSRPSFINYAEIEKRNQEGER